ncbi:hypothetical protein [Tabrizicola sp.]|uniref:hypothetical protein n=1 Tax=Tabrizicola sp. TaxID=2005166 RepID=UPI003F2ACE9F
MIRWVLLLLALATPIAAETARVVSGEHGDFTRLVIELPEAVAWTLGRSPLGYAFAAEGADQPAYDLTNVWQRIAKTRLQSLQSDPQTGALLLTLACDCHVFPFEYRPGVVVLDIKPGPAPPGSAFEADFVPSDSRPGAPAASVRTDGYDWLVATDEPLSGPPTKGLPLPLATDGISLDPLRDQLLEQLARGAAEGVVDMELPGNSRGVSGTDHGELPWSSIRIGDQPGVLVTGPDRLGEPAAATSECAPDEQLDLAAWAEAKPAHDVLAETRSGLYGEFDVADSEAVLRSVRLLLYLGFGAEARQHAHLLDAGAVTEELALYLSMARIVDGESDPQSPFATMLECEGTAALWAALVHDRLPAGRKVNREAVLRAFLALPPHHRQNLGAGLAEKFLAQGDAEAARVVGDAVERAPHTDKAAVALMNVSADLHNGDIDAAQAHAEEAVSLDGSGTPGLIALVEAHFRKLEPIDPGVAEALLAVQGETEGTAEGEAVNRALVLAFALSGQTDTAFRQEAAKGSVSADLWHIVQDRATDDDFLRHAVLPPDEPRPETTPETAFAVASRAFALGFPDAARRWIEPVGPAAPPDHRLLAARAAHERGDAQTAVQLLAGLTDPEANGVRAKALVRLGDLASAAEALSAAGNAEEAVRLGLWQGDWAKLDPAAPPGWLKAANYVSPTTAISDAGPLARGGAVIEDSLAAREAVEALLAAVPSPSGD